MNGCLLLHVISHAHYRTDLANICRRYKLNYNSVMASTGTDGEGRFTFNAFIHYIKQQQNQHVVGVQSHGPSNYHANNYYDQDPGHR